LKESENILNEKSNVLKLNELLKRGGVIAFVTDTVWGLGCLPESEKGVDKIYEIKGRDRSKPLILMSDSTDNLYPYINKLPEKANMLINNFFPGALTIVAEKSEKTPDYITSGKNTVGIRVPDNEFFRKLCSVTEGHVLATTSANLSNHPSSKSYTEAKNSIGELVDFVFEDYGYTCAGMESTVVLADDKEIKILRQGSVILDNIRLN
jgi:L-threonylcarbamoyladenylate synthase